jgi:hypothetical protein
VPAKHCLGLNDKHGVAPAGPDCRNGDEDYAVSPRKLKLLAAEAAPENGDLVPQQNDFGFERSLGAKEIA